MGRHRAQDRRPPGGVDRPGTAWWGDREDPAASLSAALRGWTTLVEDGSRGPRLVLHRSVVSRVTALVVLAPVAVLFSYTGLEALADPFSRDARVSFGMSRLDGAGAAGRPLVYRAPAWRRMWEYLCDAGLFLLCLGTSFTAIAMGFLLDPDRTGENVFYAVLILAVALAALGYCAVKLAPFLRRTVVDREGIHVGRATHPWPGSRSGLYVAGDRAVLVHPDGYAIPLPGTGGARGGFVRRETRAAAQCEEIWLWGVANGVARDDGAYVPLRWADARDGCGPPPPAAYVPLRWADGQREREIHERRAGTGPQRRRM